MTAAALLAVVLAFFIGLGLGRRQTPPVAERPDFALTSGVPGRELLELLADVERAPLADPADALHFLPDGDESEKAWAVPEEAAQLTRHKAVTRQPRVGPAARPEGPSADGEWTLLLYQTRSRREVETLRDALRASGLFAWLTSHRVDGQAWWSLVVGGFDSEGAAESQAPAVARLLPTWDGLTWEIAPRRVAELGVNLTP